MSDLELPYAYGNPPLTAVLRSTPEDFQVEEILGYDADGEGDHALLWVEKRGANTDWVAQQLAQAANAINDLGQRKAVGKVVVQVR